MKIELLGFEDLTEDEQMDQPSNGCGEEEASYLKITFNDGVYGIFSDAMEPEDARFFRDLKWISKALNAAYVAGLQLPRLDVNE